MTDTRPETARPPDFGALEQATARIKAEAVETPLIRSDALDEVTRARVFIKPECLQRTGSFKFRGAYNRISRIDPAQHPAGVVAYSSGNHAQGVAAAARLAGLPAVIVMPHDTPALKRQNTEALGARVVGYDRASEDREAIARAIAAETGAIVVPPYDDPDIIAGQGTAGLEFAGELARRGERLDVLLVPVSGGGLIAGIALAFETLSPETRIYAVEPQGFDDHARSLASGRRERNACGEGSVCDALMSWEPGELTFEVNRRLLAGGVAVSEDEVKDAVAFAYRTLKLVAEPGGAAALAAVLAGRPEIAGKTVGVVISGGNADPVSYCAMIAGAR